MYDVLSPEYLPLLEHNGLRTFDDFWNLEESWIDEPNKTRKEGWSAVSRHTLKMPGGGEDKIFVKRGEDYFLKNWFHFLPRTPVSRREAKNAVCFRRLGIPTFEVLSYGEERKNGVHRAMIATRSLTGYQSLKTFYDRWEKEGWPARRIRLWLVEETGRLVRMIHEKGYRHNMLYPKHLMVHNDRIAGKEAREDGGGQGMGMRIIDLESMTRTMAPLIATFRDLEKLHRHAPGWTATERLRFYKCYRNKDRLNFFDKWLIRRILARADRKKNRRWRWRPKRRR